MNRLSPIIAEPDKICVKFLFLTKILTRLRYDRPQKQERVIKMSHRKKAAAQVTLLLAGAVLAQPWDGKITCVLAGAGVFILLALAAPLLDRPWPRAVGAQLAKISYAVFLVHHVLIQELAAHFDLAVLSRRDTAFLFVVYLAATFAAAHALLWLQRTLRTGLAALCPQI